MNPGSAAARSPRVGGRILLTSHAVLVGLVAGYVVWSAAAGAVGANIGLGLGLLGAGLLGAPWTLLILFDERFTVDSAQFIALASAGALANLVLHAIVWARWSSRRRAS